MHMANINKFMGMVLDELQKAEGKHPKFCDAIIDQTSSKSWVEAEFRIKLRNHRGDKENALKEFAQIGAVVLRCMEFIQNEM